MFGAWGTNNANNQNQPAAGGFGTTNAFGQPAQTTGGFGAFGQPQQNAQPATGFGAAAQPNQGFGGQYPQIRLIQRDFNVCHLEIFATAAYLVRMNDV
ncbi:hypothetical protein FRC18_001566 [Serendipita sp. 400]|nr:hypothetical protein FRC18_001566 [Serendipita sp. 400]